MNSEYEALIEEHCEHCYYNKNGFCNIARADKECVYGNLKHDLQELDLLRKLQKEHAKTKKALEIILRVGFPRGVEVIDNGNPDINIYHSPYYLRVFEDDYIYDDYPLQNKEEFDLLKEELL